MLHSLVHWSNRNSAEMKNESLREEFKPWLPSRPGTAGPSLREEGVNVGLSVSESYTNCHTQSHRFLHWKGVEEESFWSCSTIQHAVLMENAGALSIKVTTEEFWEFRVELQHPHVFIYFYCLAVWRVLAHSHHSHGFDFGHSRQLFLVEKL